MKSLFITATGTGIGKTLLTCALAHRLRQRGDRVLALKPVISGFTAETMAESDTRRLLAAQGMSVRDIDAVSPWRFAAPLSPDMAAEDEGRAIDFDRLVKFCASPRDVDYLLVEGVGGIMAPLDATHTVLDWMTALGFPVVLVAGSYLGALSHTLSAACVLAAQGLALRATVISESENPAVPLARMQATLARFLPEASSILPLARLDSYGEIWKDVPDLCKSLF